MTNSKNDEPTEPLSDFARGFNRGFEDGRASAPDQEQGSKFVELSAISKPLMGSNWCIKCWPESTYAQFIHEGNSLCEKHFVSLSQPTSSQGGVVGVDFGYSQEPGLAKGSDAINPPSNQSKGGRKND